MNIEDINLNEYDCTPVNSVPSARLDLFRDDDSMKQKRDFLIKLSEALVMYGSPTHRLEHHLNCLSTVLNVSSEFFILPGVILISFGIYNLISSSNACVE